MSVATAPSVSSAEFDDGDKLVHWYPCVKSNEECSHRARQCVTENVAVCGYRRDISSVPMPKEGALICKTCSEYFQFLEELEV